MQTRKIIYDFRGQLALPAVGSGAGTPFVKKLTGSCTVGGVSTGGIALALDATSEVQNACLYMGDVLPFALADLIRFECVAKVSASLAAAVSAAFGLGSARADDLDAVAANAWFKLAGSNAVLCESDDGVTDKDDIATGMTLSTTYQRFAIDFSTGMNTQSPPSSSLGGTANLGFYAGNANGSLRRVASGTRFDLSGYTSTLGLQPLFQIQKTTGTAVGTLTILECSLEFRLPA